MIKPPYDLHGKLAILSLRMLAEDEAQQVRARQLCEAMANAQSDPSVSAIVLLLDDGDPLAPQTRADTAALRWAIAGAEASRIPVVCALGKSCTGAAFELALACHYRVAEDDTRVALPDIRLGQLPPLGATTRLPRLIGFAQALELILSGEEVAAPELDGELLDRLVSGDARAAAMAFAEDLVVTAAPPRPTRQLGFDRRDATGIMKRALIDARSRHPESTPARRCIEDLAAELARSLAAGDDQAPELLDQASQAPISAASDYATWCQTSADHASTLAGSGTARSLERVAIVGAGIIGTGIAAALTGLGLPVTLIDKRRAAIDTALSTIAAASENDAKGTTPSARERGDRARPITGSVDYEAIRDADLVIEAVFEERDLKQEVFRKLDRLLKPGAILATSTSTLSVNEIADVTGRPADVVGLHFLSPVRKMPLLEVVAGRETSDDVLATAVKLGKALDKLVFVSRAGDGLSGNRLLDQYWRQALFLIDEGCEVERIDRAMEAWGMAMGPLRLMDLVGNDLHWAIRRRHYIEQPAMRYSRIADKLCEMGRFGQKTAAGWYRYESREGRPLPEKAVDALISSHRAEIGNTGREISDEEIVNRLVFALINEGARILEDNPALTPADIDTIYVAGYGFPRDRGGPMYFADTVGINEILQFMEDFAEHAWGDPAFWTPAPLLVRLANERNRLCG